jgi:hypothetical protein
MASTFSWLDFAESDRQRAMQVIDLFREKSTVDELGFAPIRDSFADHLFPGTSTIQTRARYFLFVPWIIRRYERRVLTLPERESKLRKREARLIRALLEGGEDQGGIIGREAQGKLKRMPSSVYWRGLHLWGIRLFAGSIDQYFRRIGRGSGVPEQVLTDDREPIDGCTRYWHPALPEEPKDLFDRASLELTPGEADFLRERICACWPNSMLAYIVTGASAPLEAEFAWDPDLVAMLPSELREVVEHARLFSLCAWGGPMIYSRMVAVMKNSEELVAQIDDSLNGWQEQLAGEAQALSAWDRQDFWALVQRLHPRLSPATRNFSEQWIQIALRVASGARVWNESAIGALIVKREVQLKGGRARLCVENQRARDRWQGDANAFRMDYRWRPTQAIINDIVRGRPEEREGASHA